jgi:hypothetical protein
MVALKSVVVAAMAALEMTDYAWTHEQEKQAMHFAQAAQAEHPEQLQEVKAAQVVIAVAAEAAEVVLPEAMGVTVDQDLFGLYLFKRRVECPNLQ